MKTRMHLFLSVVTFVFLMFFLSLKSYAFDYTITFTGTGASTTVESVIVQNLTKSTTVTVPTGNSLKLSDAPNAVEQLNANDETIRVYPNSVDGESTVSFFTKQAGSTQLNAFSIDGRKIAGITENLQTGVNSFQLSLPKGAFSIQVAGNGYTYTAKMINQTGSVGKPEIAYIGSSRQATSAPQKSKSFVPGITTMTYATGDQLLYKGISGNYSTIVTDVPTGSKSINFDFVACTDADGNNYTTVTIGTQTWMAENLKTTKYKDGTVIPLVSDNTTWTNLITPGFCWYNNDAINYKNTYGALYNWYAVNTAKLAPTGWHVNTDVEWTTLANYLIANGYNYDGTTSGNKIAKALAATTDWYSSTNNGSIGSDLTKNNTSGFTALPSGFRASTTASFGLVGRLGFWWSSTQYSTNTAWIRTLDNSTSYVDRGNNVKGGGFSVRCVKGDIPTVSTTAISAITSTTATGGGSIISHGGATISEEGVCWSTSANPTTADSKASQAYNPGWESFTSQITSLVLGTTYHVRAYAINSVGTAYGNDLIFEAIAVGDSIYGGKVAYILKPTDPGYVAGQTHGLVIPSIDQSAGTTWGCFEATISGADGTVLGTGNQNTTDILIGCPTAGIAAKLCADLVWGGKSDWYLPAIDELGLIYNVIPGFTGAGYWSSSEYDASYAYYFAGNEWQPRPRDAYKTSLCRVRAVRAF
jgi:uncharacterized protein (TIGR02145 family)